MGPDCSSASPESSRLSFTQNRGDVGLETEKVDGTSAPISLWEASPHMPGCPRATLGPGRRLCAHTYPSCKSSLINSYVHPQDWPLILRKYSEMDLKVISRYPSPPPR